MKNGNSSQAGFSLIETLVAVFVVALLSAGAGIMLTQTVQAGKQVSAKSDILSEMQIANALLRDDIGSVTRRASVSAEAFELPQVFVGNSADAEDEILVFSRHGWSSAPSGEMRSDLQRISYRLEDGKLIRKAWLRPDADRQTPTVERVIFDGITDLQIRYAKDGFWDREWRPRIEEEQQVMLPDAIEVICEFQSGDVLRQVFATGARS